MLGRGQHRHSKSTHRLEKRQEDRQRRTVDMVDLRTGLTHLLTSDAADADLVALCGLRGTERSSATALYWPWELLSGSVLPGHPVVYEQGLTDPTRTTPLGVPLTGHRELVNAAAFSPKKPILATGSKDQTVLLWNVTDPVHPNQLGSPLTGHTKPVNAVAFSPDGHTLATASYDRTVRLWNVTDVTHPASLDQPLIGHTDSVTAVVFSLDGRTLVTGSRDQNVRLWNVADPAHPPLGQAPDWPYLLHRHGGVQPRRTHPRQRQRRPHNSIVENKRQRSDPADLRYYREHPYPGGVGAVRVTRLALSPAVPVMLPRYTPPVPEVKGVNP
jgi:WD40 repeat protein